MSKICWGTGRKLVLALDPGGTTGWCIMNDPGADRMDEVSWDCGEIAGDELGQVDQILTMMKRHKNATFVCEDFQLRTMAAELSPVRITATLQWIVTRQFAPAKSIRLQMPALAKSTVTDDRLKRWGFYTKGSDHKRDATRHAITFIRRARLSPTLWDIGES